MGLGIGLGLTVGVGFIVGVGVGLGVAVGVKVGVGVVSAIPLISNSNYLLTYLLHKRICRYQYKVLRRHRLHNLTWLSIDR